MTAILQDLNSPPDQSIDLFSNSNGSNDTNNPNLKLPFKTSFEALKFFETPKLQKTIKM